MKRSAAAKQAAYRKRLQDMDIYTVEVPTTDGLKRNEKEPCFN